MMEEIRGKQAGEITSHSAQERPSRISLPDFEQLAMLARTSPDDLEALRVKLCEQVIAGASPHMRKRLQGLQFRIDMERQRSRSHIGACIRISRLMNESLVKLSAALANPDLYLQQSCAHKAEVLPLFEASGH